MKRMRFSEEQVIGVLKEAAALKGLLGKTSHACGAAERGAGGDDRVRIEVATELWAGRPPAIDVSLRAAPGLAAAYRLPRSWPSRRRTLTPRAFLVSCRCPSRRCLRRSRAIALSLESRLRCPFSITREDFRSESSVPKEEQNGRQSRNRVRRAAQGRAP